MGLGSPMRRREFITPPGGAAVWSVAVCVQLVAGFLLGSVHARDNGQWGAKPTNVHAWFESLTQPDNPIASCCGEADAHEADAFEVEGNHYVAIITNGHSDFPTGARISVPNYKMKWDSGNPTGHGIIFIGSDASVLCYVPPGGV
jgi:hypothetical protein